MKQESINFGKGKIMFWDIDELVENQSLELQIDSLKEDLVQVSYPERSIHLDIGWYPSFDISGSFILHLIKDEDWNIPLEKRSFRTISELRKGIFDIINQYGLL